MSIAIGILDNYTQLDLDNCYNSIPESLKDNIFTVSNTQNKLKGRHFRFDKEVPFASMRNYALTQFRADSNLKYYFLIGSNLAITNPEIFNHTIKLASNFGTWFMTGPCGNVLEVEDEENHLTLQISPELNTNFLFIHFGIVKNCGYFNEQFYETDILDVLDYIIKMRSKDLYLPHFYNPVINFGLYKSESKIQKIPSRNLEKSLSLSFGLFQHLHQYIPGHTDPQSVSKEEMFVCLEKLQQKYARNS